MITKNLSVMLLSIFIGLLFLFGCEKNKNKASKLIDIVENYSFIFTKSYINDATFSIAIGNDDSEFYLELYSNAIPFNDSWDFPPPVLVSSINISIYEYDGIVNRLTALTEYDFAPKYKSKVNHDFIIVYVLNHDFIHHRCTILEYSPELRGYKKIIELEKALFELAELDYKEYLK